MNIDEHNEKAFEEILQLAKDNDIAAEDAELKYLDSDYPRFKDASDKKGGTSGYLKILSDEDGKIHWIMANSFHEELGEVIWRSDGLHSLSVEKQEEKVDELKKLQSQRDEQLQLQLAENRLALSELLKTFASASGQHPYLIKKQVLRVYLNRR